MRTSHSLMIFAATLAAAVSAAAAGTPCEDLAKLQLPNTKITLAQTVAAGTFVAPPPPFPPPGGPPSYKDVPAFCRVSAEISPTSDSDIKIEVWMPVTGWNGKFRGQGNGGFAGMIDFGPLGAAVKNGYATAETDTGHAGFDAAWALGHPEKVADFGWRGIHEMTAKARAIVDAFYGAKTEHAYFASCSDGGREAFMEAERFPEDYDGILAGAAADFWTHLLSGAIWNLQATTLDPASYIPAAKIPGISAAVLKACDAQDGLADGIVNDPSRCKFDPASMVCKGDDAKDCLTAPQAAALAKIYSGPVDSAGHSMFPGYSPGGEEGPGGWGLWITGAAPGQSLLAFFGNGYFSNMVYQDKGWNYKTWTVDQGVKDADEKTAQYLNSNDPNVSAFGKRGGKLIIYHGWSDAAVPPQNSINFYKEIQAKVGERQAERFVRLFMAPAMQHCSDGPGPHSFGEDGRPAPADPEHNIYAALEQWVERGTAPSKIIATKYVNDFDPSKGITMTRPLCAYPEIAKYKGSGDIHDAASFACAKP